MKIKRKDQDRVEFPVMEFVAGAVIEHPDGVLWLVTEERTDDSVLIVNLDSGKMQHAPAESMARAMNAGLVVYGPIEEP